MTGNRHALRLILCLLPLWITVFCVKAESTKQTTLKEVWDNQCQVLADPRVGTMAVDTACDNVLEFLAESGVARSTLMAEVYSLKAGSFYAARKSDKAVWAYKTALKMDPGFIPAAKGLLLASFREGIPTFFTSIPLVFSAVTTVFSSPWTQLNALYYLSLCLISSALLLITVLICVFSIRYFPLWCHDFHERIPFDIPEIFLPYIIILVMLLPLLLHLGVVWTLALWSLFSFPYLKKAERRLFYIVLVLLFLAFPAKIVGITVMDVYQNPLIRAITYARDKGYNTSLIEQLNQYEKSHPENEKVHFLLGLLNKRGGNFFDSLKHYLEYVRLNPTDAAGHLNLGNVYFILNNVGEAISEYRKAENYSPSNAAVYYNLSKAYLHRFKFQKATDMLNRAGDIDPELVAKATEINSTKPHRILIDALYPDQWFWEEVQNSYHHAMEKQKDFWIKLGPGLDYPSVYTSLGLYLGALFLLSILRKRLAPSWYCLMCGQPTCRLCNRETGKEKFCSHCQMVFLKKGQIKPGEREKKMRDISRKLRRKSIISVALSIVFPGSGSFFIGNAGQGGSIMIIWSFLLSLFLTAPYHFPLYHHTPLIGDFFEPAAILFAMLIVYILSFIFIFRESQD